MNDDYAKILPLVVTAKEMADMDRKTIEEVGVPGMVLMENAGREIVAVIKQLLGDVSGKKVVVLCGKGNNGGDGYVVARYLTTMGAHMQILLFGEHNEAKGDAGRNLQILETLGQSVYEITSWEHDTVLAGAHLVVDALLGTGVEGPLKGRIGDAVAAINKADAPAVSIDLPTGMETDTGAVHGECVNATATVTMAFLKRGLLFSPAREHAGKVYVADIGIPRKVVDESSVKCYQLNADYIAKVLPGRAPNTFKNQCGQVLTVAGSVGLTGAAVLSSEATLRAGAGMAILGLPKSVNAIAEEKLTEVMTLPLPETDEQSISFEAKQQIAEKFAWANVVAMGPGLTTHADSVKLVKWILQHFDKPIVMDADALNSMKDETDLLRKTKAPLILTPHPGELSRLINKSSKEIVANPVDIARETARNLNVVLILKGAPTVIAAPDGAVFINSTGNPGLATAGVGDVLTGVVAGLAAQGLSPLDSALAGVYLHGRAGDIAAANMGRVGLIAGDVLKNLPFALKEFEQ